MIYTWLDCIVFLFAIIPTMLLGVMMGDTILSLLSSLTGILYVLFCAKGLRLAYGFGLINCVCYAYLSYSVELYGETLLNVGYYMPLQVVGFCAWRKQTNQFTGEVFVRALSKYWRFIFVILLLCATGILGLVLDMFQGASPYVDAFTTVASICAMTLTVGRYIEQWVLWFMINGFSIYLWAHRYCYGKEHVATLAMWVVFLFCAIYGYWKWRQRLPKGIC